MNNSSTGLPENLAACLAYALGWITGLIFLLLEKRSTFVRFHAMQSLMAFGIISLANVAIQVLPGVGTAAGVLLALLSLVLWIAGMMQAWQGKRWKMPLIGDEAERQANRAAP